MSKKRSGKFYFKNEKEVMKSFGLEQTPGSGNGWVIKEDGQNENVIAQLKSTDAMSISISKLDLEKLKYNASVSHKLPVFIIQFLIDGDTYLLTKAEELDELVKYINTGTYTSTKLIDIDTREYEEAKVNKKKIMSGSKTREKLHEERKEKHNKIRSAR